MQKNFENKGTTLLVGDLSATIFTGGPVALSMVTFDKELLDMYAEDYIKEHFEISSENKKSDHKNIRLPEYLTSEQKSLILNAIKSDIPILVSGVSGPTGKTTLVEMLREQGVTAFEKWECQEINLSEFLE
ncbi:hypothetical protein U1299_05410 [Enterococcus cecorum]|uniref:Uncharacterized protein n=1 Tax=Enterococcus cecorum TaxID=44008 RepID=A0AAW9JXR9_9ENTE|nr:hypothetical protein [Enterococcus cecorum]MDZ5504164.1 hypothetical protein [Enterococcus cecorum]MDZ5531620.1 hypothetical protein [Enterococcus cecorum]MDZ5545002.1 hypothetical protein [Enterococcus cecorum]MDZ5548343.1 hypothetical protein [Enterococcus cecorum]MDZ5549529.1 hypothetical protein [Enterococcus cecorum]